MVSRLAVIASLFLGVAHADNKVDWSQYIEAPGAKGPAVQHRDLPQAKGAPAAASRTKQTAAKPAPAKAKPKASARKKR